MTTSMALGQPQLSMLRAMLDQQQRFRLEQLAALDRHWFRPSARRTAADLEVQRTLIIGARAALADVQAALARMDGDSYGYCIECGDGLPLERLEILPHAALCMSCQRAVATVI